MKDFDSILAKARKLAALADAQSGAAEGERENAERMLREHCERYGIKPESLSLSAREEHCLLLVPDPRYREIGPDDLKPSRNRGLITLAIHTWMYVTGEDIKQRRMGVRKTDFWTPRRKKDDRAWPVFEAVVEATPMEFDDWRDCFYHYAPDFLIGQSDLRANLRALKKAVANYEGAFVNAHDLFPPSAYDGPRKESTLAERLATRVAASFIKGDTWERNGGKLKQGGFFLV